MSKFELFEDSAGEWRFNLKANNGQVVASSQGYDSKQGAKSGIKSIKKIAFLAKIVEVKK